MLTDTSKTLKETDLLMEKLNLCAAFSLLTTIALSGCASLTSQPITSNVAKNALLARQASCEQFYQTHDNAATQEKITDIQTTQINAYPFLSVNRFLVSFKNELANNERRNFWLAEAAKLNRQKRNVEWLNMSVESKTLIQKKHLRSLTFKQRLTSCSEEFLARLKDDDKPSIIKQAKVKKNYSTGLRSLGLYPVTSIFVQKQIAKNQRATRDVFNKKLNQLYVSGELQRYIPEINQTKFTSVIDDLDSDIVNKENPLSIPFISSTALNTLFNRYAPTLEIDESGDYDKTGEVKLDKKNIPYVDTTSPVMYTKPSYTRFAGKIRLQLNYVFWFPERPSQSGFDIYAGKLDGIIWRVTLDENFTPLLFDSIHNCGCYHKFYASKAVKFNMDAAAQEKEPPFLAQVNLETDKDIPWVLRISSKKHYIERVYQKKRFDKNAKTYLFESYHQLRHLAAGNQNKSLFSNDGLVENSKRIERFALWPMGIKSAGAMRQWGHHATVFVGKRYFDEAYLFDKFFTLAAAKN